MSSVVKERANPTNAWIFSLLYPGAGLYLADASVRAFTIMLLFAGAVAGTIFIEGQLRLLSFHVAVLVYAYAGVDAYETARELNHGIDPDAASNPRVAALINSMTAGFGYVYLGEKFGFGLFLFFGITRRIIGAVIPIIFPFAAAGLAAHAYVIGTRHRREMYPEKYPLRDDASVPAIVPAAVALIIAGSLLGLELFLSARANF